MLSRVGYSTPPPHTHTGLHKLNRINLTAWRLNTKKGIKDMLRDFARTISHGEQQKFGACEFSQTMPGRSSGKFA